MKRIYPKILKLSFIIILLTSFAKCNCIPNVVQAQKTDNINYHIKSKHRKSKTTKVKQKVIKKQKKKIKPKHIITEEVPDLSKNIPNINDFNQEILKQYGLNGCIWQNPHYITYTYINLNNEQIALAEKEVEAINKLDIVNLVQSNNSHDANIVIEASTTSSDTLLGLTEGNYQTYSNFKGLHFFANQHIVLENNNLNKYKGNLYELVFRHAVIHELGHALGLSHVTGDNNQSAIMYATVYPNLIVTPDSKNPTIDQKYINSLIALYKNY